jgi:DNA-binding MarR family transcriptional regulator
MKADRDLRRLTNGIVSSGNALVREAGRLFRPHGLSAVQFNVLHLLVDAPGGLRPSALTAALVVDASSTTYVLDRMEAAGWLRRRDDAHDRRASRIVLTPEGRRKHAAVAPLYAAALRETLRGLDPAKIAPLADALGEIQRAAHAGVSRVLHAAPRRKPPR